MNGYIDEVWFPLDTGELIKTTVNVRAQSDGKDTVISGADYIGRDLNQLVNQARTEQAEAEKTGRAPIEHRQLRVTFAAGVHGFGGDSLCLAVRLAAQIALAARSEDLIANKKDAPRPTARNRVIIASGGGAAPDIKRVDGLPAKLRGVIAKDDDWSGAAQKILALPNDNRNDSEIAERLNALRARGWTIRFAASIEELTEIWAPSEHLGETPGPFWLPSLRWLVAGAGLGAALFLGAAWLDQPPPIPEPWRSDAAASTASDHKAPAALGGTAGTQPDPTPVPVRGVATASPLPPADGAEGAARYSRTTSIDIHAVRSDGSRGAPVLDDHVFSPGDTVDLVLRGAASADGCVVVRLANGDELMVWPDKESVLRAAVGDLAPEGLLTAVLHDCGAVSAASPERHLQTALTRPIAPLPDHVPLFASIPLHIEGTR